MSQGTLFIVIVFPIPWPPRGDHHFFTEKRDGTCVLLTSNSVGRLVLRLESECSNRIYQFQRLAMIGFVRAVVCVIWSPSSAMIEINGTALKLAAEALDESFVLKGTNETPPGLLFPAIDPQCSRSSVEYLFLSMIQDIDRKVISGTRYDLIKAAALLRQLLLDGTPLVHEVNRSYRLKLFFQCIDYRESMPQEPEDDWLNLDCSLFPGAKTVRISLDEFLNARILKVKGQTATVKDVVKACANAKGGVHLGTAHSNEERLVVNFDETFIALRQDASLCAIEGICRVVLNGLRGLVEAIATATVTSS